MIVVWLFLAVPWVSLRFVIVVFPDHNHYYFCRRNFRFIRCYDCYRGVQTSMWLKKKVSKDQVKLTA